MVMPRSRPHPDAVRGFTIHLTVYLVVNALLFGLNARAGGPWWAVWPLVSWGIGLLVHGLATMLSQEQGKDVR
jgi:hypothetical protein